jgi:RNA polymerase sigma-B factor
VPSVLSRIRRVQNATDRSVAYLGDTPAAAQLSTGGDHEQTLAHVGTCDRAAADMTTIERGVNDYTRVEQYFSRMMTVDDEDERRRCRADIISTCLPLADHIAYRFVGRGEPSEDLIQVARLGLVKTVDRYNPDKGRFLAFAVPTIIGEVRRHFRDNTWGMRVPRRIKDTHLRVRDAIDPMSQRLGRAPTPRELAAELDLACDDIAQSAEATYAYRPLSLDATLPGSDLSNQTLGAMQGAEDPHYDTIEDVVAVADLIPELSDREQAILRMRFCDCLTQTEIAKALGISQVHVSRLLSATLDRLRRRLWTDAPSLLPVMMAIPLVG